MISSMIAPCLLIVFITGVQSYSVATVAIHSLSVYVPLLAVVVQLVKAALVVSYLNTIVS